MNIFDIRMWYNLIMKISIVVYSGQQAAQITQVYA